MKKIRLVGLLTILAVLIFGVSSFAANNIASDAVNGIRNVVGGAENVIGGAVGEVTNGVRSGVTGTENAARNTVGDTKTDTSNGGYNTARTATTRMATNTGNNTAFLGMGATAWGWLIMAIVGIITVALVWYYGTEKEKELNYHKGNDDNY